MEPSKKDISDLFSVAPGQSPEIEQRPRKAKGETAEESVELGVQYLTEGDYERAIGHFKRALEQRDPGDVQGRVDLGSAYEVAEMAPEAFRQYEMALRIRGDASEPRIGLSQIYKRNARYRDSLRQLDAALALEPQNAFYRFKKAEVQREVGDKVGALESARLAAVSAPADSFYRYWIGDLLIEMKRFPEALDAFRTALDLSPGDDYLYLRAAAAFWGAGKRPEAVKSVRLAGDLDPDKDLYHGVLELMLANMGQDEEAALEAGRASKMDDYDREALRRLAIELDLKLK